MASGHRLREALGVYASNRGFRTQFSALRGTDRLPFVGMGEASLVASERIPKAANQAYRLIWIQLQVDPTAAGPQTRTVTPTGGIVFGGAATRQRQKVYVAAGGLTFGGNAPRARACVKTPSGGINFAGSAAVNRVRSTAPSGGLAFGGTAPVSFFNAGGPAVDAQPHRKMTLVSLRIGI